MTCLLAIENIDDLEAEIRLPEEIFPELYAENASMAGFLPGRACEDHRSAVRDHSAVGRENAQPPPPDMRLARRELSWS